MATYRAHRFRLIAGLCGLVGAGLLALLFVRGASSVSDLDRGARVTAIIVATPVLVLATAWWSRSAWAIGVGVGLLILTWMLPRLDDPISVRHALAGAGIYLVAELLGIAVETRVQTSVELGAGVRRVGALLAVAATSAGLGAAVGALTGTGPVAPGWVFAGVFAALAGVPALVWLRESR